MSSLQAEAPALTTSTSPRHRLFPLVSALSLAGLVLVVFLPLLAGPADHVWSKPGLDLTTQVVPWWRFGFGQWRQGNFPLWNPHTFCGTPYFSNFNTGLLYPLHWINFLLPIGRALNLIAAISVWMAGWFTSLWVRHRGASIVGSILAGAVFMFSGSYFYHLYPGHESLLASMAWTPLAMLAVDGLFERQASRWMLVGMLAIAMQILASFAQSVYLTGLVTGLSVLLRIKQEPEKRLLLLRFVGMYVGGAALGAVQLLPGMATAHESVRAGGAGIMFAAQYALPPENLLTLLAPNLFGDMEHSPYFGRSFLWEACLFCGVTTLVLAGCGIAFGPRRHRRCELILLGVCVVLALGAYLFPLYATLYYCVPFFTSFRVAARFGWFVTLYLSLFAALGFDALGEPDRWRLALRPLWRATVGIAVAALLIALLSRLGPHGPWAAFVRSRAAGPDQKNPVSFFADPTLPGSAGLVAALALLKAAGVIGLSTIALAATGRWPRARLALPAIAVLELTLFARSVLVMGPIDLPYPGDWAAIAGRDAPDERVSHPNLTYSNRAMVAGHDDIYGYDPLALKRYSDLLAATQGWNPDQCFFPPQPTWLRSPAIFRMLRCRRVFTDVDPAVQIGSSIPPRAIELKDPLPRLLLIDRYQVMPNRDALLAAMQRPDFDPSQTVLLETDPRLKLSRGEGAAGTAEVVAESTDSLTVHAKLTRPAILLITDAWSREWEIDEPGDRICTLIPADYVLRAVPLPEGEIQFTMRYSPRLFQRSKWITLISLWLWVGGWIATMWPRRWGFDKAAARVDG